VGNSQIRGPLPGTEFEHIFEPQPEPTLEAALDDPELFAEYIAPCGEFVDEPASEQLELQPKQAIARKESRCSRCGANVLWSVTEANRKAIPLNPTPSTDPRRGNFIGVNLASGAHVMRYVSDATRVEIIEGGGYCWESHFASCESRGR
jgi:hypothetical protein